MVRVNGKESAAMLTNMYPDPSIPQVLHLHMDAPQSESALWEAEDYLDIEADWRTGVEWCQVCVPGGAGRHPRMPFRAGAISREHWRPIS